MAVKTYSKASHGDTNITPNFKVREFACRDGSNQVIVDSLLAEVLEDIRAQCGGRPIVISSGYRTPAYNKKIGGASDSYHMKGQAADISIAGVAPAVVAAAAEKALAARKLAGGIGLYANFTHVDTRVTKWRQNMVTGAKVAGFGLSGPLSGHSGQLPQRGSQAAAPTVKLGDRGDAVKSLQTILGLTADGIFGARTDEAVRVFQSKNGLAADGIVGVKTWEKLVG